jgi:predicted alpha/beta-fold hydrolase
LFQPPVFLKNPHLQTILAHLIPSGKEDFPVSLETIDLPDGDRLSLAVSSPQVHTSCVVILVHGLTGSALSPYMVRLARHIYKKNITAIRVNLRGCGSGYNLAKKPYNAGQSQDICEVVKWASCRYPHAKIKLIGFSLGGNIVLKMAGEIGGQQLGNLNGVAAVSPPVDLDLCTSLLEKKENFIYEKHFVYHLKKAFKEKQKKNPEIKPLSFPDKMGIRTWDDIYTAPQAGYTGEKEYYQKASSLLLLVRIQIPTLILSAKDDPFISPAPIEQSKPNPSIQLVLPSHGGHLGFWGRAKQGHGQRWMDDFLLRWILNCSLSSHRLK